MRLSKPDCTAIAPATSGFLAAARDWQTKGRLGAELFCLDFYVQNRLRFAVRECDSAAVGIQHFDDLDTRHASNRVQHLVQAVFVDRHSQEGDPSLTSAFHLVSHVHSNWLLGDLHGARLVAQAFSRADWVKLAQAGGLWTEYAEGLWALHTGTPWQPRPFKVAGYTRHWKPYVDLISAWSRGLEDSEPLSAISKSFAARNRDRRLIAEIDGDGHLPVYWDFRLESLLHFRRLQQSSGAA